MLCSGSKTEELDQLQKHFSSPGLPLQPQDQTQPAWVVWGSTVVLPDLRSLLPLLDEFLLQF